MRFSVSSETQPLYDAYLKAYTDAVGDCLQFLSDAMKAMEKPYKAESPGDLAAFLLIRHIIESIDGVCILVSRGSIHPCEPLLRSALEASLSVSYILSDDTNRRGVAFLTAETRKELKLLRQRDPEDALGKQVLAQNTAGQITDLIGEIPIDLLRKKIDALKADLNDLPLKPINAEFERIKAARKSAKPSPPCAICGRGDPVDKPGDPEWYSLFGGPKNVQQLAQQLKVNYLYEFMYRPWSSATHAANNMRNVDASDDSVILRPIRHPDGMNMVLRSCVVLTVPLALLLFRKYSPEAENDVDKRNDELAAKINQVLKTENVPWKK
jgi:hypothetical protein